jgi:predicted nucleotidyltransferase
LTALWIAAPVSPISPGQRIDSAVPLLVEFLSGRKPFRNFMRLAFLLEALSRRRVELVTSESLSPYLRQAILRDVEYVFP